MTTLHKELSSYKNHAYATVGRRMQRMGYHVGAGTSLSVIACVNPVTFERTFYEEREFAQRPNFMPDHRFYIEHCLYPRLEDLLCKKTRVLSQDTLQGMMGMQRSGVGRAGAAPHPRPVLGLYICQKCKITTTNASLLVLDQGVRIRYGLRCCSDACGVDFDLVIVAAAVYDEPDDARRTAYLQNLRDALHFQTALLGLGLDADTAQQMASKFQCSDPHWNRNADTLKHLLTDIEQRLKRSPQKRKRNAMV